MCDCLNKCYHLSELRISSPEEQMKPLAVALL